MLLIEFSMIHSPYKDTKYVYGIYQSGNELRWAYVGCDDPMSKYYYRGRAVDIEYDARRERFNNVGYLASYSVSNDESELLTGLHYPASMDRLIEMVAEHYEPAYPVEVKEDVAIVVTRS